MPVYKAPPCALILGGASCVWEDVLRFESRCGGTWEGVVIAVNDAGVHWPRRLDHLVSLHSRKLSGWRRSRIDYGGNGDCVTWGTAARFADRTVKPWPGPSGSSGLLAVTLAKDILGLRSILCGVPMTPTPHFAESSEEHMTDARGNWRHADQHWAAWELYASEMRGWVKSMSGRTAEVFGSPTPEWVFGQDAVRILVRQYEMG